MKYNLGRRKRIQIPVELVKDSTGRFKIGNQKYSTGTSTRGFDVELAIEMRNQGLRAGRHSLRQRERTPYSIRVYNVNGRFEVDID